MSWLRAWVSKARGRGRQRGGGSEEKEGKQTSTQVGSPLPSHKSQTRTLPSLEPVRTMLASTKPLDANSLTAFTASTCPVSGMSEWAVRVSSERVSSERVSSVRVSSVRVGSVRVGSVRRAA